MTFERINKTPYKTVQVGHKVQTSKDKQTVLPSVQAGHAVQKCTLGMHGWGPRLGVSFSHLLPKQPSLHHTELSWDFRHNDKHREGLQRVKDSVDAIVGDCREI